MNKNINKKVTKAIKIVIAKIKIVIAKKTFDAMCDATYAVTNKSTYWEVHNTTLNVVWNAIENPIYNATYSATGDFLYDI